MIRSRAVQFMLVLQCISFGMEAVAAPPPPAKPSVEGDAGMIRGVTRCVNDLNLSFPITGRIASVPVSEGSSVLPGTVLAQMDKAAEALDVERRKLQWESQSEIRAAELRKETLGKQLESARAVFAGSRGISREDLENKELAYSLASAELDRLRNSKQMERLDYQTAQENLNRRTLRSPTRGIVIKIIKQAGEGVQSNEPAIRLCDLSKILFTANIPASQVGELSAGDKVELLVGPVGSETAVAARVLFMSPVVDAASGLREVKVELMQGGRNIRPGMPARLRLGKTSK